MSFANVGTIDRVIRMVLGAALILMPLLGIVSSLASTVGIIMLVVGIVLVATGFMSFCPLYRIIGASTRSKA